MDELVVPDIDTDMVHIPFTSFGCVEEDKISRFQVASFNIFSVFGLFDRPSWDLDTVLLAYIGGKPGTVERIFLSCGTPDISFPQFLLGKSDQFFTFYA